MKKMTNMIKAMAKEIEHMSFEASKNKRRTYRKSTANNYVGVRTGF